MIPADGRVIEPSIYVNLYDIIGYDIGIHMEHNH